MADSKFENRSRKTRGRFPYDLRCRRRGAVSTKKRPLTSAGTSVTETLPKEAMLSSLLPPAHNESQGNQPSDCGTKRFKDGPASYCLPETILKEKDCPLNSEGQLVRFLSPSRPKTRRAQKPNQPSLCNSWHSMSRAFWQLKATFATSSLVGRGQLRRQIYVAR